MKQGLKRYNRRVRGTGRDLPTTMEAFSGAVFLWSVTFVAVKLICILVFGE